MTTYQYCARNITNSVPAVTDDRTGYARNITNSMPAITDDRTVCARNIRNSMPAVTDDRTVCPEYMELHAVRHLCLTIKERSDAHDPDLPDNMDGPEKKHPGR